MKPCRKTALRLAGAVLVVVADQLTKHLARTCLASGSPVAVIPGFFNFALVFNEGAAWGMMQGFRYGFVILAVAMLAFLAMRHEALFGASKVGGVAAALLCGGIVGNLIDRVLAGRVTDFLDFHYGAWHFPCFNVADSAICIGVALFFLISFFQQKPHVACRMSHVNK